MGRHIFVGFMYRHCQVYKTFCRCDVLWAEECRGEMLLDFLPFSLKFGFVGKMGTIKEGKQIGKSPDAKVKFFYVRGLGFFPAKLETFRKRVPSPRS